MHNIHIKQVSFQYPDSDKFVFENLNLQLPEGMVSFIGQNGVGKSTLLLLTAGLLKPNQGEILINGINTHQLIDEKMRQEHVSFIYQNMEFETEDVIGDLLTYVYENGFHKQKNRAVVAELIREFDLQPILAKKTQSISKGELQRTIIAFSLLYGSKIIIMDEPIFALEEKQKIKIMQYLYDYVKKKSINIYYSVHDIDITRKYSDFVLLFYKNGDFKLGKTIDTLTDELLEKAYEFPATLLKRQEALFREGINKI